MEKDYLQGQVDLIKKTQQDLQKIVEESKPEDILFDVIHLLKTLVPLEK